MAKRPLTEPRPWETRRYGECAYPSVAEGETHSCCAPVTLGRSYCKAHCRVMYVPQGTFGPPIRKSY